MKGPASVLLEMHDSVQNISFVDHYMDVLVDLSRMPFTCATNTFDTVPAPLYVSEKKVATASWSSACRRRQRAGFCGCRSGAGAVDASIKHYSRECVIRR
ncbi:hypothetical protein GALMADRAFT_917633 [Galerina marginata CBS 339.88]|uniref:Uncharacterized protein n=1 Tax=Galerina marginata (strain CBS 339.88) TaxID=685588 RepID=A0A067SHZ4_GALM3|nr:hypothetical protein GALMADRAFT_917633 [Galerina marginata CBS 339.88]